MEADLEAARQGHADLTKTLDVCATERASLQAKAGAQVSAIEELHARLAVMEDGLAAERKTSAALAVPWPRRKPRRLRRRRPPSRRTRILRKRNRRPPNYASNSCRWPGAKRTSRQKVDRDNHPRR